MKIRLGKINFSVLILYLNLEIMEEEIVKLRIYGMTCEDCVATVTRNLKNQEGVLDVKVSLEEGTGEVKYDKDKLRAEELLKNKVFSKPSHYNAILLDK